MKKILLASDHRAVDLLKILEKKLKRHYPEKQIITISPKETKPIADYPIYAEKALQEFQKDRENTIAIFICGSGRGMCSIVNQHPDFSGKVCESEKDAALAAGKGIKIICIGVNTHPPDLAWSIVKKFLKSYIN